MKNTVFPHKFWRPFLDGMPQLFFRPQYVWFPVHLKGHLIPLCYETLVVNWQNWLFTLFHQSRSALSPNPIVRWYIYIETLPRVPLIIDVQLSISRWSTGPRLNIKISSYCYRTSHCGDKTVVRSSYLHNRISYTGKIFILNQPPDWWMKEQYLNE